MNIADLSKIDIKDIDVLKVKNKLLQHKEIVLQVLLAFGSFIIAVSMLNQSQADIKKYKSQIASLQSKTGAIEQYNKTQNDLKVYLGKVPEFVSEDKVINLVTDFAGKNGVKIITFSPATVEKKKTLETISLKFSLVAESFSSMIRFMADIERGNDFMQIWGCEVDPQPQARTGSKDKKGVPINFRIEVASMKVEK